MNPSVDIQKEIVKKHLEGKGFWVEENSENLNYVQLYNRNTSTTEVKEAMGELSELFEFSPFKGGVIIKPI